MVTKPNPLHFWDWKSRMTLTFWTAPKGPNSCHSVLSSVSGAKLYTNMHHPAPFRALPAVAAAAVGISVLAVPRMDPASRGEYLKSQNIRYQNHKPTAITNLFTLYFHLEKIWACLNSLLLLCNSYGQLGSLQLAIAINSRYLIK